MKAKNEYSDLCRLNGLEMEEAKILGYTINELKDMLWLTTRDCIEELNEDALYYIYN